MWMYTHKVFTIQNFRSPYHTIVYTKTEKALRFTQYNSCCSNFCPFRISPCHRLMHVVLWLWYHYMYHVTRLWEITVLFYISDGFLSYFEDVWNYSSIMDGATLPWVIVVLYITCTPLLMVKMSSNVVKYIWLYSLWNDNKVNFFS